MVINETIIRKIHILSQYIVQWVQKWFQYFFISPVFLFFTMISLVSIPYTAIKTDSHGIREDS